MLRDGWLKDQMQKAAQEVKKWPDWMVKLDQTETKMETSSQRPKRPYSCFAEPHSKQGRGANRR